MQFMIIRKADEGTEAFANPTEELFRQMGAYMEEMNRAGILRGGDGLAPTSEGARVDFSTGEATVTDGPFAETKELVAGYFLIDVDTQQAAIEWAKRWPAEIDGNPTLEIRRILMPDDFGEAFTPEMRAIEETMRQEVEG